MSYTPFEAIQIGIASPETIRSWSFGEVKKPETINYRTLKPERDGLFCERIFGPMKDWECHCGKYKRIRYKGIICDRCGVEVTRAKVRRERMGHIELAAPVSHIWYFKGIPSRIGLMLDITPRNLEKVLYFAAYIVIDPGKTGLEKKELLTEREYRETIEKYGEGKFRAGMGAEAIKELLQEIDLEKMSVELKEELENAQGQKKSKIIKRLDVVESFRMSGNKPEWMIMDVIPVIPPEIRPMVQLDGGRFATSDLNDLYRRVINRNNRLKKLLTLGAPDIIVRNEKRMLQEAVDALIDNGRRGKPVTGPGNRPLKSLSDMLKGKQGRFRQNLLGKRVDYSGRSVIVVGPELKIYQCGLPKEMALELFKPFVMKKLVNDGGAHNIKNAKKKVERADDTVWDVLAEVIKEHPVLLNRAPTLHRLGIQAFEPILVEGRAIKLHPLVCTAFNADFDGDQMAVHVPLSPEAQAEARFLILSANNLLKPQDGKPVTVPTQDMILGSYYLTIARGEKQIDDAMKTVGKKSADIEFESLAEAEEALKRAEISPETVISVEGRVTNMVREHMPTYKNVFEAMDAFDEGKIEEYDAVRVIECNDAYGKFDGEGTITTYKHIAAKHFMNVDEAVLAYENKVIKIHEPIKVIVEKDVTEDGTVVIAPGENTHKEKRLINATIGRIFFNESVPQDLGFVDRNDNETKFNLECTEKTTKKYLGKIIDKCIAIHGITETADVLDKIKANGFKYSTRGAITVGVADMEIPVAKAGYIKAAEEEVDKITEYYNMGMMSDNERYNCVVDTWKKAIDNITNALMNSMGEFNPINMMATSGARGNTGQIRQLAGIRGLMADTTGRTVEIPVKASFREGLNVIEFFISSHGARKGLADTALRTADSGYLTRRLVDVSQDVIIREEDCGTNEYINIKAIKEEKRSESGSSDNTLESLQERLKGRVPFEDVVTEDGEVLAKKNELIDQKTAEKIEKAGIESVKIRSVITCRAKVGVCAKCYGENLALGQLVNIGESVGIIAAQSIGEPGTQLTMRTFHSGGIAGDDITQGLPRVEELFEARKPKGLAMITEDSGKVEINDTKKGKVITVTNQETGIKTDYNIAYGATLKVEDGQMVEKGQELTRGSIYPVDLLRIKGANAVQEYIVQEVQKVYRLQGVDICDKHIEIIIRQMMRKVNIEETGDSNYLLGAMVERNEYKRTCEALVAEGKKPPVARDVLLGITKASLATDSFLSAASFQETTRVLTDAAIKGKTDPLVGLKENVIIGKLIPAGTGVPRYNEIGVREKNIIGEAVDSSTEN